MKQGIDEELDDTILTCAKLIRKRYGNNSTQFKILEMLNVNPEISQKEMQMKLNITPGSISETVTKMERKGLVKRIKKNDDQRACNIALTKEGQEEYVKTFDDIKNKSDMFVCLEQNEKNQLIKILSKIIDN